MGSSTFSSIISEDYDIGARIEASPKAKELQKLIVERIRLFLHSQTEQIRHDAKWIEKNLNVETVQRIRHRRTLRTAHGQQISKVQTTTAAITESNGIKTLYVTPMYLLFDVSQLLIGIVLFKPKLHSSLLLESLLSTELVTLKARGYNVDRILKARAAEARLAEQARQQREEERAKALQEEAKRDEERTRKAELEVKKQKEAGPAMPGGFVTPTKGHEAFQPPQQSPTPITSLFNRFSRHLGFDNQKATEEKATEKGVFGSPIAGGSESAGGGGSTTLVPQETSGVRSPEDDKPPPHKPTKPHVLRANLQNAINSSRSHNSTQVFNPGETREVEEQKTYCDSRPSHDIKFLTEMPSGIRVFIDRHVEPSFLRANTTELSSFSSILLEVASVFDLPSGVVHIYYDETGPTIAFNLNGSLFFNFRYYKELHNAGVAAGGEAGVTGRKEALVYWFVTTCHELAHNIVLDHSSAHSFYTESFAQMYFQGCMDRVAKIQAQPQSQTVMPVGAPPSYDASMMGGGAVRKN